MKDKKIMFVLAGAIFIVAAGVTVFFLTKRNIPDISDISDKADLTAEIDIGAEAGIHYGGDFDEFQYQEDESGIDIKNDESAENKENENEMPQLMTKEAQTDIPEDLEDIEKIKEKFESELPGEILRESDEINILNGNLQMAEQTKEAQEAEAVQQTAGDEKSDNVTLSNDLGLTVLESDGYEKNMVICDAQSLEEAEKIAAEIGGAVLSCEQGTATIKIKENVDELLERLKQQGSTLELYRKYKFK